MLIKKISDNDPKHAPKCLKKWFLENESKP